MFGTAEEDAIDQPLNRIIPQRFANQHTNHVDAFGRTLCIHHGIVPSRHYMGETRNYRGQLKGST
jgi:hypothetical protein